MTDYDCGSPPQVVDFEPGVGRHVWLNGKLLRTDEAQISVLDHAITVGDGTFEAIPVVRGSAFALRRHLARLRRTVSRLGLVLDRDDNELRNAVQEVIEANGDRADHVRLTVTAGSSTLTSARSSVRPTVLIGSTARIRREQIASVLLAPWCRNERGVLAGLKTSSYLENVLALRYANERGVSELLFSNTQGELCEGIGSNVFLSIEGELITPPLSSGCLPGITRELVIELVKVTERNIQMEDLERVSEAFLTASTRNVQPIYCIEDRRLEAPGPLTLQAQRAFAQLQEQSADP